MTKCPKSTLPKGKFRLRCTSFALTTRFGRGVLQVTFVILGMGPHCYKEVVRYYKVVRTGKRAFRVSQHSDFAREFAATFGKLPPTGLQAVQRYLDVIVEGHVEVVKRGHDQELIPDAARYSVVRKITGRSKS